MPIVTAITRKRLAAARDILAVCLFITLVILGGRALLNAPFLQKELLTRKEAAEDIEEFFSTVEQEQPGRAEGITAERYSALKAAALGQAEARLDEFGRLRTKELAYILYAAAAASGGGRTRLYWQYRPDRRSPEKKFPPFTADYSRGKFVIDNAADRSLAGAEVIAVNGRLFAEFISPILSRIPGETPQYKGWVFRKDQAFWWDFSGLFSGSQDLVLKYRDGKGKVRERTLPVVTAGEFRRLPGRVVDPPEVLYSNKGVAWLNITDLRYTRSGRKAFDRFFRAIEGAGVQDLVLDLRQAEGGDPRAGNYLMALLAARGKAGGRTWLIVGPGTCAAGALFTSDFRRLGAGLILGDVTGGTADHYGEPKVFKLANSGISYGVPSKHFSGPVTGPGEAGLGIIPDLRFTDELLRPYGGSVKAFVLDLITSSRGANRKARGGPGFPARP